MSRRNNRDPRRNAIKPEMEKLELRWLMRQGLDPSGLSHQVSHSEAGGEQGSSALDQRPSTEQARSVTPHSPHAGSAGATPEARAAQRLLRLDLGPWGVLRLLDHREARGDHRFDALHQWLSAKFDRWAAQKSQPSSCEMAMRISSLTVCST